MAEAFGNPNQTITLCNPVGEHFATFVVANAEHCDSIVRMDSALGEHIVICGAGPSLREHAHTWCPRGDQVWGCNSAATWLYDNGHKVTHAFTVDQTTHMVTEWWSAPPVSYLVASTVHPHLIEYLESKQKPIKFFHNYVGIKGPPVSITEDEVAKLLVWRDSIVFPDGEKFHEDDPRVRERARELVAAAAAQGVVGMMSWEDFLYWFLYPTGMLHAGSGLNSVTRAIDIAMAMGAEQVTVLGADCALRIKKPPPKDSPPGTRRYMRWLRNCTEMHADGGNAVASDATPITMGGTIDGVYWQTKPDMIVSAVWLEKMRRFYGKRLRLIGNTLPNALRGKSEEYLKRLPSLVTSSGEYVPTGPAGDHPGGP